MLRLGIDVDGVVADFRSAFRALAERELGITAKDAESDLTKADIERLWRAIAGMANWWLDVPAYEPDQIDRLYSRVRQSRWEVFFVTSRPPSAGDSVQLQTQVWLERHGFFLPSVLTAPAGARGELARCLRLDIALDDRIVNCLEITSASNSKAVMVLRNTAEAHARESAEARGVGVVSTLSEALDAIERLDELLSTRRGRLVRLADWFQVKKDEPGLPMIRGGGADGILQLPTSNYQGPRHSQLPKAKSIANSKMHQEDEFRMIVATIFTSSPLS